MRKGQNKIKHGHNEIRLLIFGGNTFQNNEGNDKEFDDKTYILTITPGESTFKFKYLPGAKMRQPDKFFNNM